MGVVYYKLESTTGGRIANPKALPNKHRTSSPPAALSRTATPWRPADPHPLGGTVQRWLQGGTSEGCWRLAASQPTLIFLWPASVPPVVPLQRFWPPPADLKQPLCLLQRHRIGFQPSSTGWIVEAGLPCANLLHVHQRPAGGPLNVNRRPACPPLCLLSPLRGQLLCTQKCL